ncbi:MAG TPA: Ig-like domain repeat protein [Vicinamibacterales bacterium]
MRSCARTRVLRAAVPFFLALATVALEADRAGAQTVDQRWDGLIEDITVSRGYFPPVPPPSDGPSELPRHAVSADGRYVLFTSQAPNIGNYGSGYAVYLRDRRNFETRLLLAGPALDPVMSADGNHVAFQVCDPYAHVEGPRDICDVYAIDLRTWMWTNLSAAADGTLADADSGQPTLSGNGRFVVFRTKASNIAPGLNTDGQYQIVIRDRDADGNGVFDEPGTAVLETISVSDAGAAANGGSESAELSDDGRYVAFRSLASNLVPGDTNAAWDVFLRDRTAHQTRRINVRPEGQESPFAVTSPAIAMTPDGRLVAFTSADGLLAPASFDDANQVSDVFVYDVAAGVAGNALTRIDLGWGPPTALGYVPGNGPTEWPMFSADGRYLTVQSTATNVEMPGLPGRTQIHVVDRSTGVVHRISINPDGTDANQDTVHPQISGDGSMVVFASTASNLRSDVWDDFNRIYAAVYFDVTPPQVTVGAGIGGTGTFTVAAQQHTNWWAMWDWNTNWITIDTPPMGIGSGSFSFRATMSNPDPVSRSLAVHAMSKTVYFAQSEGLALHTLSPSAGPENGGTRVTLTGIGFEAGMQVVFDGWPAETEFIDSTTMIAITPPHQVGPVWVAVFSMTDQRAAWIPDAFRYTDSTPPNFVFPYFSGTQGSDGWYTSDVTVNWAVWDDQSPILSTSGCDTTIVNTDTNGRTFTCSATSEGGTTTAATVVKRDATPPTVTITRPAPRALYEPTETVTSELSCSDPGSGVADCGLGNPTGSPVDLSYSGWHTMWAGAMDVAGNFGASSVDYAVATGYCMTPMAGLRLWFDFNGDIRDKVHGYPSAQQNPSWSALTFGPGKVGTAVILPGWQSIRFTQQLDDVHFTGTMTFAAWVKPDGESGEAGTIVSKEDQFRIARFPDGTVRFAFANANPGLLWTNTNAVLPAGVWTHLVVTFAHGVVNTYLNGTLVHTYNGAGDMQPVSGLPFWGSYLSIGNREDPQHPSFLIGAIDEVQISEAVWDAPVPESLFLTGASGTCALTPTVVAVSDPVTNYGASTVDMLAQLRVAATQAPLADRGLRLVSRLSRDGSVVGTTTLVTDSEGFVRWSAPIAPDAPPNNYTRGLEVFFDADFQFGGSMGIGQVSIRGGVPSITWPTPAPIVYGTALGAAQQNATADVPGLFFYSQASGTVLPAGQHALSVTFQPNSSYYDTATASVTLTVLPATPSITWPSPASIAYGTALSATNLNATANVPGSFSYSPAAGTVLHAGTQTLSVTFAPADAVNYAPATATTTIEITRATPTVTVSGGTFTYDGNPHASTGSVVGAGGASLGSLTFTYNGAGSEPVDAGSYPVVGSFAGNSDYAAASASGMLVINRATVTFTVTGGTFTYDKQPHPGSAAATGVLGEPLSPIQLLYDGTSSGAPVDAGAHTVRASFAGSANYAATQAVPVALTINKAVPVVEFGTSPVFYTASPHDATVTVRGIGGDELYPYVVLYDGSSTRPTQAGSYALHVQYNGSANYEAVTGDGTFVINRTTPIMSMAVDNATYDGQPHGGSAAVAGYTGEPLTPVVITYNGSTTVPVNAGVYTVEARYDGSTNYTPISRTMTLTISQAVPYVRWFPGPGTIVYGTALGAAQLSATASVPGSFAYTPPAGSVLNVGSYQLTAAFTPADPLNYTTASISATLSVSKVSPTISVTGGSFTFDGTAHVATGSVTGIGGAPLGPLTFTYNGGSSAPVNAGTYTVVASFAGDADYSAVSSSAMITIAKASPALSWPAPAATYYGAPLGLSQLNATVNVPGALSYSPTFGAVLPAGAGRVLTVTFTPADSANYNTASASATINVLAVPLSVRAVDAVKVFGAPLPPFAATFFGFVNGDTLASLSGSLGFATTAAAGSPIGSYPIAVSGVSSPNYVITFVGGTLSIVPAATTVTAASSPAPSGLNQPMTFTASVAAAAPGAGTPTGSIQFFDGTTLVGTATLAGGDATLTTAGLTPGSHSIEARYGGDASFAGASGTITHVVNDAAGTPTVLLSTSANPVAAGGTVTFTATVTLGSGSPSGVVGFYDGDTLLATRPLSSGRATFAIASLAPGTHAITARYLGSAGAPPSRSTVLPEAVLGPGWKSKTSATSISPSANPSALGSPVDFTVTVSGSGGAPTGRVLFMINGAVVGNPAGELLSSGHVTLRVTTLNHGRHDVTATYLGDTSFKGSTAAAGQIVN